MTEVDLLKRVEEQAAEIASLKSQLDEARSRLISLPGQLEKQFAQSMARTAVNCGHGSSCAVAGWWLEAISNREEAAKAKA